MREFIGIIILCCGSAVMASSIQYLSNKKAELKSDGIKNLIFYLFVFYGVLSGIKSLLGEPDMTLFSSFMDILPQTYIHYGIPLIIISILLPILIRFILRDKQSDFISFFDSLMFCAIFLDYVLMGKVNNVEYFIFTFGSGIISLVVSCFYTGKICYYSTKEDIKERLKYIFPVLFLFVITVIIYIPNELYLSNVTEFQFTYSSFLMVLLVGSILFICIGTIGSVFLATTRQFECLCFVIFICTILGYIQGNILNGTMSALDGTKQTWSVGNMAINCIIWIACIVLVGILLIVYKEKTKKIIRLICIYVSLIQIVSLIFLLLSTDISKEEEYALTTNAMLELDKENNVIVFILDWYDEQIMEKIVAEEPDFLNPLSDFTWYQNTASCYAFTDMSIPYLLTGVKWEYDMSEEEYCKYAYENSNFLRVVNDKKYDIGLYTVKNVVDSSVKDIVLNYQNVMERRCGFLDTMYMIQKCSKYKMAPFILKANYWYATSDISALLVNEDIYVTHADMDFYNDLTTDRISIRDSSDKEGAFRFYHFYGAHLPYVMDEEGRFTKDATMLGQAKGCLNIIYEFLEQMKRLGIYDDATIIITADHGQNTYMNDEDAAKDAGFEMTSNPILFVKESGETGKGEMKISMAPVSHEEFIPTILEAVGEDKSIYGRSFEEVSEAEERDRIFIYGRHDDYPFVKYQISGNIRDVQNWQKISLP